MKLYLTLLILITAIFSTACSTSNMAMREQEVGNSVKPLMDKNPEEQQINISVPIYKF